MRNLGQPGPASQILAPQFILSCDILGTIPVSPSLRYLIGKRMRTTGFNLGKGRVRLKQLVNVGHLVPQHMAACIGTGCWQLPSQLHPLWVSAS